jgi:pyocin large subunit-like protein
VPKSSRSNKALTAGILVLFAAALAWAAGGRGFRTQHLLEEHFTKHGHEFGQITRDQYLHMAQQLRDSKPGKNVLEARRSDGGGAKFDKRFGWFVAYDADGTLRTFFVPNEGIRYFERQGRTYGPPE